MFLSIFQLAAGEEREGVKLVGDSTGLVERCNDMID